MAKRPATPKPSSALPPFTFGSRILRDAAARPYNVQLVQQAAAAAGRREFLPPTRRLLIYTRDPSSPRMDAAVTEIEVPYEPLNAGPAGSVIRVRDFNQTTGETLEPLELDGVHRAFQTGLKPSTTDPLFAQQMCYALTMATYEQFRQALGRPPDFAFDVHESEEDVKLHVFPHAIREDNAWYDPDSGGLYFGYTYALKTAVGANQAGGIVFTALSHDVVVHEMTHALLDGMRARFMLPTNPDVDGFHEGFADLVALFQRFRYRDLVRRAMTSAGGKLTSGLLVDIARQFGETTGDGKTPLRVAFKHEGGPDDPVHKDDKYSEHLEGHDMGAVLLQAVFDAFRWIFDRKTANLRALVPSRLERVPAELVELLARDAEKLAGQFLRIVIRALDYCPPVDLKLGEFLRAIITADYDLVPDDPWAYREAFIRAFRRYGITVQDVPDLSEDALLWCPPEEALEPIQGLQMQELQFGSSISDAAPPGELRRRAQVLGEFITHPDRIRHFGLEPPSRTRKIEPPVIETVRVLQRVGPDGTVNFDLVAEVIQRRRVTIVPRRKVKASQKKKVKVRRRWVYGGSTIILDASGYIRYIIVKNVASKTRERRLDAHLQRKPQYARYFSDNPPPASARLRNLHRPRKEKAR